MATSGTEPEPTTTILRRLAANVVAMFETYAGLAGREARATVRDMAIGVALLAAAAAFGVLVLTLLVLTVVLALATVVAPWLAALIMLGVTALAAAVCVAVGLGRMRRRRLSKLAAAVKEDLRWLRSTLFESDSRN
ncbi:MAG: phage holin family protein [bacterium]